MARNAGPQKGHVPDEHVPNAEHVPDAEEEILTDKGTFIDSRTLLFNTIQNFPTNFFLKF